MGFCKPKPNCLYPAICILQQLLMFPCFCVGNPSHYAGSALFNLVSCHKDVFYDFLNNGQTKWRRIMYYISCQLWEKIVVRADHKKQTLPTVLIFDDTDIIKSNSGIEMVSKIFSHVTFSASGPNHKNPFIFSDLTPFFTISRFFVVSLHPIC